MQPRTKSLICIHHRSKNIQAYTSRFAVIIIIICQLDASVECGWKLGTRPCFERPSLSAWLRNSSIDITRTGEFRYRNRYTMCGASFCTMFLRKFLILKDLLIVTKQRPANAKPMRHVSNPKRISRAKSWSLDPIGFPDSAGGTLCPFIMLHLSMAGHRVPTSRTRRSHRPDLASFLLTLLVESL